MSQRIVTAAMLAIGDELLSGRTKDRNIAYLANYLTAMGIELCEARIVGDTQEDIVAAINALRTRYDYLFTSGGIGPTHDDITADAVAAAFDLPIDVDPRALKLMSDYLAKRGLELTEARKRMARLPSGAQMIENSVSVAPGIAIGNVFVMAGVPSIFVAMLESVAPQLITGEKVLSVAIDCAFPEGEIGNPLARIQSEHGSVSIGSYPRAIDGKFTTEIVVRGRKKNSVENAKQAVMAMLADMREAKSRR